jgi:hypothetical protein
MYSCTKCGKGVIVLDSEIIRACADECKNEPIVANATATMVGKGGVEN